MARLRAPEYRGLWVACAYADPPTGDPSKNGAYRGRLPVRKLPPGVTGEDLRAAREAPARGQLWRRGPVSLRIVSVTAKLVTFREINFSRNVRTVRRSDFLRSAHRKAS